MAARFAFFACALLVVPAAIWVWFLTADEPPAGQVWLSWLILLAGPVLATIGAGMLTRRSTAEITGTAVASTVVTLVPIVLLIMAIGSTVR